MNEGTTQSGTYIWETGGLFTITSSNVGVPLEFRIGRREANNQLDALVLDLDHSLTPSELDALFDEMFVAGDFNEDGFVDGNDLLAWQAGYGTSGSASHMDGDANEDGNVDGTDFLIWQRGFTGSAPLTSQAVAVPECTGMTLCLLGLLVPAFCTRSRNSTRLLIRSSLYHV